MFAIWKKTFTILALSCCCLNSLVAEDGAELLKKDVGTWKCEIKMFADPSGPPSVSQGTETNYMIGEHWLISHFKGELMGMNFEGSSQTGYDAQTKKYVGTWVDSMSAHPMKTEGTWDAKSKTLSSTGQGKDPEGNMMKYKMTVVYKDDGSRHFTMLGIFDGAEVKMMEIQYTKAAAR